jgi:hypothetical protein
MTRIIIQGIEDVANVKRHICCKNYRKFRKLFEKGRVSLWFEYPNLLGYLLFLRKTLSILNVFIPRCGYTGISFKIRLLQGNSLLLIFKLSKINVTFRTGHILQRMKSNDLYRYEFLSILEDHCRKFVVTCIFKVS